MSPAKVPPGEPGRVLVVDDDYDILDALATSLRGLGHHVSLATEGRSGLQRAVETGAEVVLVDREVQVLDLRTFVDILSDNPRTADAHIFVLGPNAPTGPGASSGLGALSLRCEPIVKPFHAQQVAARVDEVIRLRRVPLRSPELEGDLQQVSLFDLLQVFASNRRTGVLRVTVPGGAQGEIWLEEGLLADAALGSLSGAKALHRILALQRGQFVFEPDQRSRRRRLNAPVDHALMDAARLADERKRIEERLPSLSSQLRIASPPEGESGAVHRLVVESLDEPRSIEELLDVVSASDLEILQALESLLDAGALSLFEALAQIRFCLEEELPAVRAAVLRMRRPGAEGRARVGVTGPAEQVLRFGRALAQLEEHVGPAEPPTVALGSAFGSLGALELGGSALEIVAVPADQCLRPWWGAALVSARVVLVLEPSWMNSLQPLARNLDLRLIDVAPGEVERPSGAAAALRVALGPVIRSSLRPPQR